MTVRFDTARFLRVLIGAFLFLTAAYAATVYAKLVLGRGELWGLTRIFDMDQEATAPAWFESCLFLITAALLALIGHLSKTASPKGSAHWGFLSWVFVYLSLDEMISIHELLNRPVRQLLGITSGPLYYAWVIPGMVIVLALAAYCWRFLLSLPRAYLFRFTIAAAVFNVGAMGMELAGADLKSSFGKTHPYYLISVGLEEALEMAGVLIFIAALLDWLKEFGNITAWEWTRGND